MAVRISCAVLVIAFAAVSALAMDSFDNAGLRIALRVFEDCSKADGLSPCLKKKAITFLDRLGRMDKLSITDEITVVKAHDQPAPSATPLTEDQIEKTLPRAVDARDETLTNMLWDKVTSFVKSRNIEFTTPKLSDIGFEEGRKGDLDFGGGGGGHGGGGGGLGLGGGKGGGGGKKGNSMMMGLMMGMMGKMMGLIPIGIAGLFLLAGKALITAKIALLISGIIAIKKLVASKGGGGGGGHGGHGGGGGHGAHVVWASPGGGGGGGWDRRSLDDSHSLAYSAHKKTQ